MGQVIKVSNTRPTNPQHIITPSIALFFIHIMNMHGETNNHCSTYCCWGLVFLKSSSNNSLFAASAARWKTFGSSGFEWKLKSSSFLSSKRTFAPLMFFSLIARCYQIQKQNYIVICYMCPSPSAPPSLHQPRTNQTDHTPQKKFTNNFQAHDLSKVTLVEFY